VPGLVTNRLRLRQWQDADLGSFAALNADSEVMRYFPESLTREQSDELASKMRTAIDREGWGLWAVEVVAGRSFIGFVGLNPVRFKAHFTPAFEVGWRLARPHWGNGYATEAAGAALSFGFEQLGVREIVSFTAAINDRSIRVMRRLGMSHDPADDFEHPNVPHGQLRHHVLYRISKDDWLGRPNMRQQALSIEDATQPGSGAVRRSRDRQFPTTRSLASGALAAAILAAVLLAGCGGSSSSGGAHVNSYVKIALAYSRCMRSHGVPDFPDPNSQGNLVIQGSPGSDLAPGAPAFQAALKACGPLPSSVTPVQEDQEFSKSLKAAACMRANGVPNMPDPKLVGPARDPTIRLPLGNLPGSPAFQRAAKKCGAPSAFTGGGPAS
jgi:RimJ/RimL family protein N-acetyltransferase